MARQRGRKWMADVRHGSDRLRPTFDTQHEAEVWEAEARLAIAKGNEPVLPGPKRAGVTLRDALQETVLNHWTDAKSRRSLESRGHEVIQIIGPAMPANAVKYEHVRQVIYHCKGQGNSGATINRKLAALSKIMRIAQRMDASVVLPPIDRQREGAPREAVLSKQQLDALVEWPHWKADEELATMFLIDTGCRWSEMATCVVDLGEGSVTFNDRKDPTGKSKSTTLPLTKRLVSALSSGGQLDVNYWTYKRRFDEAVVDLKLPAGTVVHTLRHTCATRLAARGADLFRLQEWMGHSALATTRRYVKTGVEELAGMARMLE